MLTSQMIFTQYRAYGATPDPARLSAQVITGMGFLGAGTIMKEGVTIKGLTTAASIWATACMGIAVGGGYYSVALIGAAFMMITLVVFEGLQQKMMRNHYELYQFTIRWILPPRSLTARWKAGRERWSCPSRPTSPAAGPRTGWICSWRPWTMTRAPAPWSWTAAAYNIRHSARPRSGSGGAGAKGRTDERI